MSATTYTPIVKVQSSSAARNALRDVAEFRARHWRAQSVILSSLLAGNAFAIGHHFFYQSLHHVPTDETTFAQDINIGIGTAFAFVVKMFFGISVATAYWQVFWHDVKADATSLSHIDTLSSVLGNALELFHVRTFARFPGLFVLAAIAWLLPLASIPSPAALTVQLSPDPFIDHVNTVMPIPNFNTSEYAQIKTVSDDSNFDFIYNAFQAPRYGIQRIANAVASTGAILKLPALEPNSSYSLSFPAPALQCNPISDSARDEVLDKLSDMLGCNVTVIGAGDTDGCESPTMYYAWAPNATDLIGLFNNDTAVIGTKANFSNTIGQFGTPGEEPTTLYVATQPLDNLISPSPVLKPWSLTNCSLYNSTYAIHVNFTSGAQRIEVESVKYANPVGYQAMLDAYGENAPGNVSDKTSDPFIGEPEPAVMLSDWTHFAYYSLMDALGTLLTGQIQVSYDNVLNVDTTHTMAMTTSLIESNELSSVYRYLETCISTPNACNVTDTEKTTAALQRNATMADLPVTAALEQLFQNLTLSLLSDNRYLTDPIKSASPTTKVTLLYPQNRYVYLWSRLVAAYLAALVFTLLACSAGFWALRANGASYSQRFSTVLRVATRARLEGGLRPHEIPEHGSPGKVGADPLPEGAGRVRVWLRDPEDKGGYDELRRETITVDGEK